MILIQEFNRIRSIMLCVLPEVQTSEKMRVLANRNFYRTFYGMDGASGDIVAQRVAVEHYKNWRNNYERRIIAFSEATRLSGYRRWLNSL